MILCGTGFVGLVEKGWSSRDGLLLRPGFSQGRAIDRDGDAAVFEAVKEGIEQIL